MHSIDFSALYFLESSGEERKMYNISINVFDRNTNFFTGFFKCQYIKDTTQHNYSLLDKGICF